MSEWWLSRGDGKTEGPLSTRALVDGLVAGDIPKRSHVCGVGEQQWHLVSEIEEIWEAVEPSESRTSVTETPWFVDRTESGKHELIDAAATGDERTQLTAPNGQGGRPHSPKVQSTHLTPKPAAVDPEGRYDAGKAETSRKPSAAMAKPVSAQTSPATPNARPSHAPPVPRRGSAEATIAKSVQQPARPRPSPAPPVRARNVGVGSPIPLPSPAADLRSSTVPDPALMRASAVPTSGVADTAARIFLPKQGGTEERSKPHQSPPTCGEGSPESVRADPIRSATSEQSAITSPIRDASHERSRNNAPYPRASSPDLANASRLSSPGPIAAGLTPLGLKPQSPLSPTRHPFAGLAGLSPLPGAVSLASSRQQLAQPAHPSAAFSGADSSSRSEPGKPAPLESARPSSPPANRNVYGASPLSAARERATTPERSVPEPRSAVPASAEPAALSRTSPNTELASANTSRTSGSDRGSGVTIQPIIALAEAPAPTAPKFERPQPLGAGLSTSDGMSHAAARAAPKAPVSQQRVEESPLPVPTPQPSGPSEVEWDEDDPTHFVTRPAMASAILETRGPRTAPKECDKPSPEETGDEATTLLHARVEPNRSDNVSQTSDTPVLVAHLGNASGANTPSAKPTSASLVGGALAALAEAHALGPESIVADPNQLLADVDDDAGPPEIPIVQLPIVAPRALPAITPPVAAAPISTSPPSSPPTALAAPPSTPPPAHNPRLSVPTIVLKPEPIVHQEATQPAVRAMRKRSPFRLSYGSLAGVFLALTVAAVAMYLMILQR